MQKGGSIATHWAMGTRKGRLKGRGGKKAFILNKTTLFMGKKLKGLNRLVRKEPTDLFDRRFTRSDIDPTLGQLN